MLVGRLAVDSPRDRGQRAQQLRWRKAANPGQPGPGFSAADIGDRRWRPDLDRRARIGGAADGLGLILRLPGLSKLGLRILGDEFAFIGGLRLGRCGRGFSGAVEFGQFVIALADARSYRRCFRGRSLAGPRLDGHRLSRSLRRFDLFGLVRARDQVSDGSVASARLEAE